MKKLLFTLTAILLIGVSAGAQCMLAVDFTAYPATCLAADGKVVVKITGVTGGQWPSSYTYYWNDPATGVTGNKTTNSKIDSVLNLPAGTYWFMVNGDNGCIYKTDKLVIGKKGGHTVSIVDTICTNDSLLFDGKWLKKTGNYLATFTTSKGCDSIVFLDLTVMPTFKDSISRTICQGDSVKVGTQFFKNAGTYLLKLTTKAGCDSTVTLNLTVLPKFDIHITTSVCAGDSVVFSGQIMKMSGNYIFRFKTSHGCDSVITLHLTFLPKLSQEISRRICPGDSVKIGTQVFKTSGTYVMTLKNAFGCDSTITLNLDVIQPLPPVFEYSDTCVLSGTGVYQTPIKSSLGCDSITIIHIITLRPGDTTRLPDTLFVCDSTGLRDSIRTLKSSDGCDSIVLQKAIILKAIITNLHDTTVCNPALVGDSTRIFKSHLGCDSIVINQRFLLGDIDTIFVATTTCDTTKVGITISSWPNQTGCDTVVVTATTLRQILCEFIDSTICQGQAVVINGQTYTKTGNYELHFTTSDGCDSMVIFSLVVSTGPVFHVTTRDVRCFGESNGGALVTVISTDSIVDLIWSNGAIDAEINNLKAGIYSVTLTDIHGCEAADTVTVLEPTRLGINLQFENPTCYGDHDGFIDAQGGGGTPPYTYLYNNGSQDHLQTSLGAGDYTVTVTDANGCTATSSYSVTQPDSISITSIVKPSSCEGTPSGSIVVTATGGTGTLQFYWNDFVFGSDRTKLEPGTYRLTVVDANGCLKTDTFMVKQAGCEVWFSHNQLHIIICRNPDVTTFDFTITIYDEDGKQVKTFNATALNGEFEGTFDLSDLKSGLYYITVIGKNNEIRHGSRIIITH